METHLSCRSCDAPLVIGQEYCLECGASTAAPPRPLHWLWPSLAALVVAAGAAAVAVAAGGGGSTRTVVALSPLRSASAIPAGQNLAAWPRTDGYTIVLAALPVERGIGAAKARASAAVRAGLPDVGVLASSDYASLHPGYYLVFAGVYATPEEAQASLPRAARRFGGARVRQITR